MHLTVSSIILARTPRPGRGPRALLLLGCLGLALAPGAATVDSSRPISRLAEMSLEDLADLEISTVSKQTERRSAAAAAIHVITRDDIRNSPALTLPELLRTVPGVHVASLDASVRSVSIRGFGGRYATKLLVLVDGRSIYTPLFSGVVWEAQDIPLEDIERIEVIRGPGGSLWGANAVNGVINIITRNAADTQGGLLSAGAGTEYPGFGFMRYGGKAGEHGHYRLYLRYLGQDNRAPVPGRIAADDAEYARGGARWDWDWGESQLTVIGELYGAETTQAYDVPLIPLPISDTRVEDSLYSGGSLLGRWARTAESGGKLQLQAYYDRADTNNFLLDEDRETLDLQIQYLLPARGRHEILWGGGARFYKDRTRGSQLVFYDPPVQSRSLYSAFIQDRIAFFDERLTLTLGSKFEYNDFTGLEIQPSARIAWTPNHTHTLWAAISRAVRTPSVTDDSTNVAGFAIPGLILTFEGDSGFDSEDLLAIEAGYRAALTPELTLDLALFHNRYHNLRTTEIGFPHLAAGPRPLHIAIPAIGRNNMDATAYGAEIDVAWQAAPWWRLRATYSYLHMDLDINPESIDFVSAPMEKSEPRHQASVESWMNLGESFQINLALRYVDRLPALDIDEYVTLDAGLTWSPSDSFDIQIVGHDLLESRRLEYDSSFVNTAPTQAQRGVYGKVTWRF